MRVCVARHSDMGAQVNIIEAARAMKQGKEVRRKVWVSRKMRFFVPKENPFIMDWYGDVGAFSVDDILADNWEVVDEQNV